MRTDREHLCRRCLHRQPKALACAACGHEALADLRTDDGRESVRGQLEERAEKTAADLRDPMKDEDKARRTLWILRIFVAVLAIAWPLVGGPATIGLAALLGALFAFNAFFLPADWLTRRTEASASPPAEIAPPAKRRGEAGTPDRSFTRVVGRVRCVKPVHGLLSGLPCAAARVMGATAGGAVDDALCGEFDLLDAQGEVVARVREGVASVEVPVASPRVVAPLPEAARAFLDARMLFRADGRATLGEGRVEDGDHVTCEGPSKAESEPAVTNYRANRLVMVYRGTVEHPLVVRRVDP